MLGQQDPECHPQVRDRELVSLQIIGKDGKGEGEGAGKGILSLWTFQMPEKGREIGEADQLPSGICHGTFGQFVPTETTKLALW